MKYRRLPGTDLDLSVVGMGLWAAGGLWWGDDVRDATSIEAIHAALDQGVNWFDTAPLYGHGHADEVLVRALGNRIREVVVATKVGVRWEGEGHHAHSDLTPAHVRADCEASLRRLGLERIDLLQIHWPCERGTPLEDTLGALEDLRREGKVRFYGLCNYDAPSLRHALEIAPVASLQTPYSIVRREFEQGLRDACLGADGAPRIGVLAYEPLCRGLLTGKFRSPPLFPESDLRSRDDRFRGSRFARALTFVGLLAEAAARLRVPTAALAIAWVCTRPAVTAAIAGAKRREQVIENAAAADLVDHTRLWAEMAKVVAVYRG
jgi:aryl-alcohol dehydrogenase-like predicted oxidoreductase